MKKTVFLIVLLFLMTGTVFSQQTEKTSIYKLIDHADSIKPYFPDSSLKCYSKVLSLLNYNKKDKYVATCYGRMGDIYNERSDLQNAYENYLKLIACAEITNDTTKLITGSNNLSMILNQQRKFKEAISYVHKAIVLSRKTNDHWQIMNCLINLSGYQSIIGQSDSSIIALKEAQNIAIKHQFEAEIPNILANLGNTYYNRGYLNNNKKDLQLAASYAQQAIDHILGMKDPNIIKDNYKKDLAYSYGLKGAALSELGNYTESETAYQKAIAFFVEQKDLFDLSYLYFELTNVYINSGQNKKAEIYLERYDSTTKALYTKENTKAISEMQTKYETEKKEEQNKALRTENELSAQTIRQQKLITYFIIGGLLLTAALAFFIFRGLKKQRIANKIISEQKAEVELQKHLVEEHQKEILDSIHYAKRIQKAHLPTESYVKRTIDRLKEKTS